MTIESAQDATHFDLLELFVQGQGIRKIGLITAPIHSTVQQLLADVVKAGFAPAGDDIVLSLEDADEPVPLNLTLQQANIGHRARVHVHRCRRVTTSIHFNSETREHRFPAAAVIAKVHEWAVGKHGFNLNPVDAVEHVLQISGSSDRPDDDAHLGTLVHDGSCTVSFDLVPKQRVEG